MKNNDEELQLLMEVKLFPSLRLIAPFMPCLVTIENLYSLLLLFIPLLDYYSFPSKISRKYILNYEKKYLSLLLLTSITSVILAFVDIFFWVIPIIIFPFAFLYWIKYCWNSWWKLNSEVLERRVELKERCLVLTCANAG